MMLQSYSLVSLRLGPRVTVVHVIVEWSGTDGCQGSQKMEDCQSTIHYRTLFPCLCVVFVVQFPHSLHMRAISWSYLSALQGPERNISARWMDDCATPKDPTNRPPTN